LDRRGGAMAGRRDWEDQINHRGNHPTKRRGKKGKVIKI